MTDYLPDVVILDISMPEMTGIEISRNTVNSGFSTLVVLLTMREDPSTALEAQEAGAAGYILKGTPFEDLLTAVRTVVASGTFVTPSIPEKLRKLQCDGRAVAQLSGLERKSSS